MILYGQLMICVTTFTGQRAVRVAGIGLSHTPYEAESISSLGRMFSRRPIPGRSQGMYHIICIMTRSNKGDD